MPAGLRGNDPNSPNRITRQALREKKMALVEIKFRPWTCKASLNIEVGDDVNPIFRMRAALETVVGEVKEGKRSGAVLSGADLSDAVLSGAVLSGADLSGADLSGADLSDADLRGAVLSGADLSGADLSDADLSGAVLSEILETVPLIPSIDAAILAAIEANKTKGTNGLDMRSWHGKDEIDETNWCSTTHCRAGYAICLAGKEGFALEKKYGPANAGMFLYLKSTPNEPVPNWTASNQDAMADMKARAARQTGGAQ